MSNVAVDTECNSRRVMNLSPQVTVVVVSYNTRDLLIDCVSSILRSTDSMAVEIVIVDNASGDGSVETISELYPQVTIIVNRSNRGFGAACNQAIRATTSPLILLLNSDARLTAGAFCALYNSMNSDGRCGAVGCRMVNPEGVETINTRNFLTPFNQAFGQMSTGLAKLGARATGKNKRAITRVRNSKQLKRNYWPTANNNGRDCAVDWIDGACLMIRRVALDQVGLFDEQFFMYSEDEDLCFRLRKHDWLVCYSAAGTAIHHGGASSARDRFEMLLQFYYSQMLFLSKHRGVVSVFLYLASMSVLLSLKWLMLSLSTNSQARESAERLRAFTRAWRANF